MAFSCVTPFRPLAPIKRQARRCQSSLDANQSLLLMRTAAQELRLTPRFERDTRERAAPLVILLDVLMLICFVREGRRGGASSNFKLLGQARNGIRWTIHCIDVCKKHGNNLVNHCRENCLVGLQGTKFAKSRWVAAQNAEAKDHTLKEFFLCGISSDCGAGGWRVV